MQRIVDFGLDVQGYLDLVETEGIGGLEIPEWALRCPFCEEGHWLRLHGSYGRQVATGTDADETRMRRLYCSRAGKTVSLLPSCFAPLKQHTWDVVGEYYEARHQRGLTKSAAMEQATSVNPSRQKGSYWDSCLERNAAHVQTYLASIRKRARPQATIKALLTTLARGHASLPQALALHNQRIHERLGVWLL